MSEIKHVYEVRPRKDKRGFDLISDALPFLFFRNFVPPFSVEQIGMEAPACFPTNENVFALLSRASGRFQRVVKFLFYPTGRLFLGNFSSRLKRYGNHSR